jgi:hypothetical protein
MNLLRRTPLAAAAVAVALVPASAIAAPDRTGAVTVEKNTFKWDSKLGTGFTTLSNLHDQIPCGTPGLHDCDMTLIKVTDPDLPGTLAITNESSDPNAVDTDLYVYASDKDGNNLGQLGKSAQGTPTPNESTSVNTEVGDNWFLIEIDYTDNLAGTVHGTATYTPTPPETEEEE